jgi:hypothetical protein
MDFSLKNLFFGGLGAWAGYTFQDFGLISAHDPPFSWYTRDRLMAMTFFAGLLIMASPSLLKEQLKSVPYVIVYFIGSYLLGTAVSIYQEG